MKKQKNITIPVAIIIRSRLFSGMKTRLKAHPDSLEHVVKEVMKGLEVTQIGGHTLHPVVAVKIIKAWAHHDNVFFHFKVLGQRMLPRIIFGHRLECVAFPVETACELGGGYNLQEFVGFGIDECAQLVEDGFLGLPHTATQHDVVGLEMNITPRHHSMSPSLAQHAREIIFVGALVVAEPDVAIDAVNAPFQIKPPHIPVELTHQ